ncbi:thymidylate synthase [Candidatus Shapirobacteria bacterium CG09_land_8_20_14_0_10_38_17]|uniref:Thymidylate synthase n=1 Tax=Candidatus Shapirobacteria bacterium CG09_land_8_20_14_0_10_38_17 TaxID=1974884 RepID=A0A2H0WRB6_9BACT|nr:MAG: thymidylate synthase [Candidatus Shapirobacteria bacterium CG09_land_8_20_14_0_10_38_17]
MSHQELEPKNLHIEKRPLSPLPQVEILGITTVPNAQEELSAIATAPTIFAGESARTCYSNQGIYRPSDYLNPNHKRITDEVIQSTRAAGHLTTRQHFAITFGIANISRQLIWSFLHNHPFYNSEQVSQRYVAVKENNFFIPPLENKALEIYTQNAQEQIKAYHQLKELLSPDVSREYLRIFPSRKGKKETKGAVEKKAQEIARYVLGVDTFAYLYHTINPLTLLRYFRACSFSDVPLETKTLIYEMVNQTTKFDPRFLDEIDKEPFPKNQTPEWQILNSKRTIIDFGQAKSFKDEFDQKLGDYTSKLTDWSVNGPQSLATAIRTVLGITTSQLSDREATELVLNPAKNKTLNDILNLTTLNKISQALHNVSYTFSKKLSHTADSQDQRHRMIPGARPLIATHYSGEPDYITPLLIQKNPKALSLYQNIMEKTFTTINQLLKMGIPEEYALYRLPNAFPIRFTETGSLLNLHHKYRMRLCYNAQREIWQASKEEVEQISQIHPQIGRWLLAPCGLRRLASISPFCPEGNHYCGQQIWEKPLEKYPLRII